MSMSDIEERLRWAHPLSPQYAAGSMLLVDAANEITRLQSEVERLRGRLCKTCEGTGIIGGPSPSVPDEGGEPCPECNAWLLRKQAEAVEEAADAFGLRGQIYEKGDLVLRAQRLRQQAAESEQ